MGTLSDITAQVSNTTRRPNASSLGYQSISSPGEKENLGNSKSPHFMTPTFSSKQSTTPTATLPPRSSTPISVTLNKQGNGSSFLKRVGLRRMTETTRSKNENVLNGVKGISFPDKLATPAYTKLQHSPPSMQQTSKVSPHDKPLPTPPVGQLDTSSPVKTKITLIDAAEKPLRRSRTGMLEHEEDWPTLRPRRATSSGTLQEVMRQTGSELFRQASTTDGERYPRLSGATGSAIGEHQLPISTFSSTHKIPRKELSSPNLRQQREQATTDPFRDVETLAEKFGGHHSITDPSALSAGAAALEKSTSQDFTEVRQTRTSSLRARLSAGEIVSGHNSKITGFTDFTAEPSLGNTRQGSFRTGRSSAKAAPSLNTKASRESMTNRPPAKFIAGSRRPALPRRPGSKGSLHDVIHPADTKPSTRPSSRDASSVFQTNKNELPTSRGSMENESRRSSIPVPKIAGLDVDAYNTVGASTRKANASTRPSKKSTDNDIHIFNDHVPSVTAKSDKTKVNTMNPRDDPSTIRETIKEAFPLEAIDESPRHAYRIRRLSTKSPNFGPTLSISPSADKYIFGSDDDKENRPNESQQSKEFNTRKTVAQTSQISRKISTNKNRPLRPLSSHGQPSPRISLIDANDREKKARSADLNLVGEPVSIDSVVVKPLSKNPSVATTTSSSADPFYDASEEPQIALNATPKTKDGLVSTQDEESIPPASNKSNALTNVDTSLVARADTASNIGENPGTSACTDEYDPFKYDTVPKEECTTAVKIVRPTDIVRAPKTPAQPKDTTSSTYPKRSSSDMDKSDVNITVSKTFSIHAATKETGPPTPPKEFGDRQNNLGSSGGHASSQIDLLKSTTKRDSAARESFKSQTSMPTSISKGRFNLKGLFQKRQTENNDTATKPKRKTKGKVAIDSNGSPFPPINEVHPIHRPTLASSNRSRAPTPRTSTNLNSSHSTTKHPPQTPSTLILTSPEQNSMSRTTSLAMSLLESARREQSSPKKEKLLALGKVVVDVITQARDAEKAVEECKLALGRAEKAREACAKAVNEVGGMVEGVRGVGGLV